jgi:hypothetical protein
MANGYAKYSGLGGSGGGGSGVSSLNGETGAVTLVAGSGITVTPAGSNITIAATGSGGGTVTSVSVVSANGLAGSVATPTSTPAITLSTTVTGLLQGNGTAISAATTGNLTDAGTDGITVTGGTGAVIGSGTSLSQHVADTTHNGYLSSTDWNTFNSKQSTITTGNLTDAGTDGIVVTGGTGAIIGSGTSLAQHVADTTHNGYLASADWNTFNSKQAGPLTGDVTTSGAAATLATVNTNTGNFGSSTSIPNFTVNAKGLITAAGSNVVVAPAGTLTGTTLASNVVSSSLTSVGTITSGIWNGTTIAVANGGTGLTTLTANNVILGNGASNPTFVAPGTSGNVLTSNGTTWTSVAPSSAAFQFFSSNQVTTNSSIISSNSFNTFNTSPGFTFTPTVTGKYKVYASMPIGLAAGGAGPATAAVQIIASSGSPTILNQGMGFIQAIISNINGITAYVQSVYTLTASTSYTFDVQGAVLINSGNLTLGGTSTPWYMFAEQCG